MDKIIEDLRKEREEALNVLHLLDGKIKGLEEQCKHDWTEPKYVQTHYKADDLFHQDHTSSRWERTCNNCGKNQITYRTACKEVPYFAE